MGRLVVVWQERQRDRGYIEMLEVFDDVRTHVSQTSVGECWRSAAPASASAAAPTSTDTADAPALSCANLPEVIAASAPCVRAKQIPIDLEQGVASCDALQNGRILGAIIVRDLPIRSRPCSVEPRVITTRLFKTARLTSFTFSSAGCRVPLGKRRKPQFSNGNYRRCN